MFLGGSTTELKYVNELKRFPYLVGRIIDSKTKNFNINAINSMLEESINIQNKYFLIETQKSIDDIDACINDSIDDKIIENDENKSIIKVDLGNGQIGNLNIQQQDLDQKKNEEKSTAT